MAERIEQYLDEVGAHVRGKRVRPALTQELRTHLEEQAEAYRAEGLPAAEAEAEAVRQMGDAEQIGLALDAVHRPKRQTAILSLAGICILLGAIFRILSQDSPKLFTLAALADLRRRARTRRGVPVPFLPSRKWDRDRARHIDGHRK